MDGRIALTEGAALTLRNREGGAITYVIQREIGRGGSCIVYDASYADNLGNPKLVRIKECCPHGLRMARRADGSLEVDARDRQDFAASKRRMIDAYQQNHELFSAPALTNYVSNTSDIYERGGTVYIVSTWSNSETLAEHRCESFRECIELLISVGKILQRIHEAGYLYLDLKPENILILNGTTDLVQLFDFDSIIPLAALRETAGESDVRSIRISYTNGFAPLEQQTGKLRKLDRHSDVYSLGAVLFHALWGRAPGAFDCDPGAACDFGSMRFSGTYPDGLYRALTEFFHRTLSSYPGDRYASMSDAVAHLTQIARLSDEALPWLRSTPVDTPAFFTGRERELAALSELLHAPDQHIFSLTGIGGIGKSTLAREYLARHRDEYGAALFLYDSGDLDLDDLLADDLAVSINAVERIKGEPVREYLPRKLNALQKLCDEQSILVVLDNFSAEHLERAQSLFVLGWKVLLISRDEFPEGFCPSLRLGELPEPELARLFSFYAHCALDDAEDFDAFAAIAESVGGHTLLLELIARQIARDHLSLPDAAILAQECGFSRMSEVAVDYIRDRQAVKGTVEALLGRLLQVDRSSREERRIMKLLSLFDAPGIPVQVFRDLAELKDANALGALEAGGWLKLQQDCLSMHPVLREYVQNWPWQGDEDYLASAEAFLNRLYDEIKPAGMSHDTDKQYPESYDRLGFLLRLAEQAVHNLGRVTPAGQRLRYRLIMDSPVDQDERMLHRCLALLKQPAHLDSDSVLHLFNQTALLFRRCNDFPAARKTLRRMKRYLLLHPSAYYSSVRHNTLGNFLHDMDPDGNFKRYIRHQNQAIAAAKLSRHPEARKQLATCLLDKAMSLLDLRREPKQCSALLNEAAKIIDDIGDAYGYERYHWLCIAAMYHARVTGDDAKAMSLLEEATRIADVARDSAMSYADHLVDQCAPIYCEMKRFDDAVDAIEETIRLCDESAEIAAYRRLRFDASLFLARIRADAGDYIRSEAIYDQLEADRENCPFTLDEKQPLCPQEVRDQAAEQRRKS